YIVLDDGARGKPTAHRSHPFALSHQLDLRQAELFASCDVLGRLVCQPGQLQRTVDRLECHGATMRRDDGVVSSCSICEVPMTRPTLSTGPRFRHRVPLCHLASCYNAYWLRCQTLRLPTTSSKPIAGRAGC